MSTWRSLGLIGLVAGAHVGVEGCSDDTRGGDSSLACEDRCPAEAGLSPVDAASSRDASPTDARPAVQDGSDPSDAGTASDGSVEGGITWTSGPIRPTRYRIPDVPPTLAPCKAAGNGTISAHEVLAGQTHLTPAGWPFQTVSANRPLTIAVSAQGSGTAPSFVATARLADKQLAFCLLGPGTLPADRVNLETSTYRADLPAAWVQPGLEVDVAFGGRSETLKLDVKPENGLTLYLVHARLFGAGSIEQAPEAQLREFLARLPVSYLDVGVDPFGVWSPSRLLVGPRDDGLTANGTATSQPAMVVAEPPHCTAQDKTRGSCAPYSGFGAMSAVLEALDTFREANGVGSTSTWYADLSVALGGGLAGGQRGTGDDTGLTMNHELGHAWGFPHWATSNTDYPYEGVQRDNGGFGDRWAVDQQTQLLLSPSCDGKERQSPMQRAGSCVPKGSWFDPYSDYEAARLLRMTLGASTEVMGSVAYTGGSRGALTRAFRLPKEGGRPRMVWNPLGPGMTTERYDEATRAFVANTQSAWNRIAESEVPVVMFAGAVIVQGPAFFEPPVEYIGNVLAALDPKDPDDYAYLYGHRSSEFHWARDLHLRFTLDDGSGFSRIYGGEAVLRADGDHVGFAINLPAALGKRVVSLDVVSRPLGQYSADSRLGASDSAVNYYDRARVLSTWHRK